MKESKLASKMDIRMESLKELQWDPQMEHLWDASSGMWKVERMA